MKRPTLTSRRQRIQVAQLSGWMQRMLDVGGERTLDQAVASVHAISRDPLVIGDVLGIHLDPAVSSEAEQAACQILRAAGADETQAEQVAAWLRWRAERDASADGPVL